MKPNTLPTAELELVAPHLGRRLSPSECPVSPGHSGLVVTVLDAAASTAAARILPIHRRKGSVYGLVMGATS